MGIAAPPPFAVMGEANLFSYRQAMPFTTKIGFAHDSEGYSPEITTYLLFNVVSLTLSGGVIPKIHRTQMAVVPDTSPLLSDQWDKDAFCP